MAPPAAGEATFVGTAGRLICVKLLEGSFGSFFHQLNEHINGTHQNRKELPETNMDPENGTLKDGVPLQTSGVQGPC